MGMQITFGMSSWLCLLVFHQGGEVWYLCWVGGCVCVLWKHYVSIGPSIFRTPTSTFAVQLLRLQPLPTPQRVAHWPIRTPPPLYSSPTPSHTAPYAPPLHPTHSRGYGQPNLMCRVHRSQLNSARYSLYLCDLSSGGVGWALKLVGGFGLDPWGVHSGAARLVSLAWLRTGQE